MAIKTRSDGVDSIVNMPFRQCLKSDFNHYKIPMSKHDPKGFWKNHLCADMKPYSDLLKVKNGYHNYTERVSFDLEILACKDT